MTPLTKMSDWRIQAGLGALLSAACLLPFAGQPNWTQSLVAGWLLATLSAAVVMFAEHRCIRNGTPPMVGLAIRSVRAMGLVLVLAIAQLAQIEPINALTCGILVPYAVLTVFDVYSLHQLSQKV